MTYARALFTCSWLALLSACAPVMLGRTPIPAAVGANDVYFAAGFPISLTPVTVCSDPYSDPACPFEGYISPDYWPRAAPVQIMNAWGVAPDAEVNATYSLLPPGFRIGGKTRILESSLFGTLPVAADYGASLYLSNGGIDAGLLMSVPYSGGEVYGALRGFGTVYWVGSPASFSGALTLGNVRTVGSLKTFVEVTFSSGRYNEFGPTAGVSPLGLFITPAFGIYF